MSSGLSAPSATAASAVRSVRESPSRVQGSSSARRRSAGPTSGSSGGSIDVHLRGSVDRNAAHARRAASRAASSTVRSPVTSRWASRETSSSRWVAPGGDVPGQHVQDLEQLELVVQVVLEPQPQVALVGAAQQLLRRGARTLEQRHPVTPPLAREERGPLGAQHGVVDAAGNRALVQDVAPGQHGIVGGDGLDLGHDRVPVRHV